MIIITNLISGTTYANQDEYDVLGEGLSGVSDDYTLRLSDTGEWSLVGRKSSKLIFLTPDKYKVFDSVHAKRKKPKEVDLGIDPNTATLEELLERKRENLAEIFEITTKIDAAKLKNTTDLQWEFKIKTAKRYRGKIDQELARIISAKKQEAIKSRHNAYMNVPRFMHDQDHMIFLEQFFRQAKLLLTGEVVQNICQKAREEINSRASLKENEHP